MSHYEPLIPNPGRPDLPPVGPPNVEVPDPPLLPASVWVFFFVAAAFVAGVMIGARFDA